MKIRNISIVSVLIFFLLIINTEVKAFGKLNTSSDAENAFTLKQLMVRLGTLMAGIEILQANEKTPDREAINWTLNEMSKTLKQMQSIDKSGAYKKYTDVLAAGLLDLQNKNRKKDKHINDGFSNLIQTCFQCHAMHRPTDYLFPKDKPTARTP